MAKNKAKFNKFLTGAVTATMVAAAVVPTAAAETPSFSDVPTTDTHYKNITQAVERGLFGGHEDGTFKPYNEITRGQVAKVLARYIVKQDGSANLEAYAIKHDLVNKVTPFADVPVTHGDSELVLASGIVKYTGVFTGSNNNLLPSKNITREQMAKVIVNAFGLEDLEGDLSKVKDNDKAQDEFVPFINILSENGVTTEENFNPKGTVKRGQVASFLNRAYDVVHADDAVAPEVVSVSALTANSVEVTFKGNPKELTAKDFAVSGGLTVIDVKATSTNKATLTFSTDMTDGAEYELQLLDAEDNVTSKATFKYELGEVASISLTKAKYEVGENVKDFLKVFDDKGVEISKADYNVTNVESSNITVVEDATGTAGKVAALGTSNLRFEIEYKDGSKSKSDFIRIDVEQAVTAELAGFELAATATYANTEDYRLNGNGAKSSLYEIIDAAGTYLHVYADDSKTNPEIAALDLESGGDYTVESKTPAVITVDQDANGAKLTPISKGKATIVITGKNNYKQTLTIEVKEDPKYKDLLVGATSLKLSDEVSTGASSAVGVNQEEVKLQWVDQYGKKQDFTVNSPTLAVDEIVQTDAIETGDKLVISVAQSNGAFDLTDLTSDSVLELEANPDKIVKNASIRVSYYANANDNKPTTQKVISTSVVDIDPTAPAYNYETLLSTPAIDAHDVINDDESVVTGFALDVNGNRIADVTGDIVLTYSDAVTLPERVWFDLATTQGTVGFKALAEKQMTETGTLKLEYTVANASQPHGAINVAYDNSFKAPNKAVVNTSSVLVDTKAGGDFAAGISAAELLFGKVLADSSHLVIDTNSVINNVTNNASIAVKKGFTGYANKPVLSFLDRDGKALLSGAGLYGLDVTTATTGNGYLIDTADGSYDADTEFVVKYSITNAKDLGITPGSTNLDDVFEIDASATQASFTIVVTEVTVANDPRVNANGVLKAKNLLDAPKAINVILSK